jgi:hypothetical protein
MTSIIGMLCQLESGSRTPLRLNGATDFVVYYDEQPALGDDNEPVKGDVTGEYELCTTGHDTFDGTRVIFRQHVSPHGTSGYGNDRARPWAAEQVLNAMVAEHERQASAAKSAAPA